MVKKSFIAIFILISLSFPIHYAVTRVMVSEETRIRKQFNSVSALISKERSESTASAYRINLAVSNIFHDPFALKISDPAFSGHYRPQELAREIIRIRSLYDQINLSFHDLSIEIIEDGHAEALFTAQIKSYRGERGIRDVQEMEAELRKINGDWFLTKIKTVVVLRK